MLKKEMLSQIEVNEKPVKNLRSIAHIDQYILWDNCLRPENHIAKRECYLLGPIDFSGKAY